MNKGSMNKIIFKTNKRTKEEKPKKLRRDGVLPANIYGSNIKSQELSINPKNFEKLYDEVGDSGLFYIQIDDSKKQLPVLISEVQNNVLSGVPIHVSFRQVDLKDKIKAEISIEVTGEFGVKNAVLVTVRDTIEVEALPTDLPENFIINIESLTEVGQSISLQDLEYDKEKVEIVLGEELTMEDPVLIVQELKEEQEEEPELDEVTSEEDGAKPEEKEESSS